MTTLYIDRKGIQLDHEPGVAVLRAGGDRLGAVPLAALHRLVLRGVSTVSTRLLAELWTRRISLVVLGGRKSEIVAMMHGPAHRDADIRLCQYALHGDEAQRRQRARQLIGAKMKAQLKVLRELAASRPDARHRLLAAIAAIDDLAAQLAAEAEPPIDRIRGLEGPPPPLTSRRSPPCSRRHSAFAAATAGRRAIPSTPACRLATRCCISRRCARAISLGSIR